MRGPGVENISDRAREVLRRYWGYDSFKPLQLDIITSVMEGHDTLGLLPTGGGKSLTFQIPALLHEGLTVVVTPLVSLMKDQVDNLRLVGIRATYLHAGMTMRENRLALDRCRLGKVKLVYVSPEKLQSKTFMENASQWDVSLIVVDEAHCISQWGYDFRPSYRRISQLRKVYRGVNVLALTASATPAVVDDIMLQLEFGDKEHKYSRSFHRDNLSYIVRQVDDKGAMLLRVLQGVLGTGIVYVRSRRRTRELAEMLVGAGISAEYYHAGLPIEDKEERQNRWKSGETRVIVSTNAFGMGIDKPDVRVVVHYDLPPSLEEYYQEAGRAGRDGKASYAVILTNRSDRATLRRRLTESFPPRDYIKRVYELAGNFLSIAVGDGYGRTYEFDPDAFCRTYKLQGSMVRSALNILTQAGYMDYVDDVTSRSRVLVTMRRDELYGLRLNPMADQVLNALLRLYTGLFSDYTLIREEEIARMTGVTTQTVYEAMLALRRGKVLDYVPHSATPYIIYTTSREEPRYIVLPKVVYEDRREALGRRLAAMERFAYSTDICRDKILLEYFGEKDAPTCGRCDVCRTRRSRGASGPDTIGPTPHDTIRYLASQPGGHTAAYIIEQSAHPQGKVVDALREMLDDGELHMTEDGRIEIHTI